MFKLVVVGGKKRGEEFPLKEGENIIGRDPHNGIVLDIDGISKKHVKLTVEKDSVFLEDLESSNGTFVNGKLVKKITLIGKEKIALPDVILQLIYVKEIKKIIKKKVLKGQEGKDVDLDEVIPPVPTQPLAKILHYFRYKVMPFVYTFNKEYEWHSMTMALLIIYILITIGLTIIPVLDDNRKVLIEEIYRRGIFITKTVEDRNRVFLLKRNFESIDTEFLNEEPGIEDYELYDVEGRILRPVSKLNTILQDTFSIAAKDFFNRKDKQTSNFYMQNFGDGKIGIAKAIRAYNMSSAKEITVGIIAIKFAPRSLIVEAANNKKAYLESFTTSALVGIIFFAILYFLTLKHFEDLRIQIDRVIRGKQKEVIQVFRFKEIRSLIDTVNGILQRYLELQNQGTSNENFGEEEEDSKYVEILKEFLRGANGPTMILNSTKLIQSINLQAEDLIGIRESVGIGVGLLDVARDQGFAATVLDLCEQSATNGGVCQTGNYDLTGIPHKICVNALMGKDKFAKAFYITFLRDE